MPDVRPKKTELTKELYERSSQDLLLLKQILPQDAVRALAREALARLAARVSAPPQRRDAVEQLCDALVSAEIGRAADLIDTWLREGAEEQALYLDYLAPAARELGEMWNEDKISFTDVTIGTGRIYGIMRSIGRNMRAPTMPTQKSAMVASVPGETHTIGAKMAAELLRGNGWDVELALGMDHEELIGRIMASNHLIIGYSAGGEHALANLARLVVATRVCQPYAHIMVSGRIVEEAAERIKLMGVDGMSHDFDSAQALMDEMWAQISLP